MGMNEPDPLDEILAAAGIEAPPEYGLLARRDGYRVVGPTQERLTRKQTLLFSGMSQMWVTPNFEPFEPTFGPATFEEAEERIAVFRANHLWFLNFGKNYDPGTDIPNTSA